MACAVELRTCFTPGENCTALIVSEIDAARDEVLIQAYGFTSSPIVLAIARAHDRGVRTAVILDRINVREGRHTGAAILKDHGVETLVDDAVRIAHNKVIVIDETTVITGSFNFTAAAQRRNAENVVIIKDNPEVAAAYADNWRLRAGAAHAVP